MENRKYKILGIISLLVMLVVLTSVFILTVTYGGSYAQPDAMVTYTKNRLDWSIPTTEDGIGILNIFGDPAEGEDLPLVHPFSRGKYYLRLKNDVHGAINYSMYIYCENEHNIPLEFNITGMEDNFTKYDKIPKEIRDKQILKKVKGYVDNGLKKDFEIDWRWVTDTDEIDTSIGNAAVDEDMIYTIGVMIVVEDNNIYKADSRPVTGFATGTVRYLHRLYVIGYPEGDVRPEGNMTRAEAAAIFARILANYDESNLTRTANNFTDVPQNIWYTKYISKIEDTDIMNGYPDRSFVPDGAISRAEFAAVCVRYSEHVLGKLPKSDISFTDLTPSHWSYEIIEKAVRQGYVKGYPDGSFRPDDKITRSEVVTVVNRMLGRKADKKYVDENLDKLEYFWDLVDNEYWAYYELYEATNTHHTTYDLQHNEKWFD